MATAHQILRSEMDSYPGIYSALTDQEVFDELTAVNKTQNKAWMRSGEILSQQDDDDYLLLSDAKKDRWLFFISSMPEQGVDPWNHAVVAIVQEIWGVGSSTILNLANNRTVQVSRLYQLSISNITVADITAVRAL